jgi:hypothetical protein
MRWSRNKAIKRYDLLARAIKKPSIFFESKLGADLWIDGYNALASTNSVLFLHYLNVFEEIHAKFAIFEHNPTAGMFKALDGMLLACSKAGEAEFLHALAVSICVINSCDITPTLVGNRGAIINDTVAILLSPNYRAIRLAAYNLGVVIFFNEQQNDKLFAPQHYQIFFGRPIAVKGKIWKCQFYNVAHEAGHSVYFGDGYFQRHGNKYRTAQAFLAAEESLIGVDLLIYSELSRFDHDLHCLKEFGGIDIATGQRFDQRVAIEVAQRKNLTIKLQKLLRRVAFFELDVNLGRTSDGIYPDAEELRILNTWIGPKARNKHVNGSIELAAHLFTKPEAHKTLLMGIRSYQIENISRARTEVFSLGEIYMSMIIPEIDHRARRRNLSQHRRRRALI